MIAPQGKSLSAPASARLSAETDLPHTKATAGEHIAGVYRQRLTLTSGRFAMIDNGLGFHLVRWSPPLENRFGQHIAGIVQRGRWARTLRDRKSRHLRW